MSISYLCIYFIFLRPLLAVCVYEVRVQICLRVPYAYSDFFVSPVDVFGCFCGSWLIVDVLVDIMPIFIAQGSYGQG